MVAGPTAGEIARFGEQPLEIRADPTLTEIEELYVAASSD